MNEGMVMVIPVQGAKVWALPSDETVYVGEVAHPRLESEFVIRKAERVLNACAPTLVSAGEAEPFPLVFKRETRVMGVRLAAPPVAKFNW